MKARQGQPPSRWLSLGEACRLLEVNESTLRGWADQGLVRVFRTPGGHRRFLRQDLLRVLAQRPLRPRPFSTLGDAALQRIRRRLRSKGSATPAWLEGLEEESKARLRLLGRRLLELTVAYLTQRRRRSEALEEVRLIGQQQGEELARQGVPLGQAMQAFIFFRNSLEDALWETARRGVLSVEELRRNWHHLDLITDEVLLAMAGAYERHILEARSGPPGSPAAAS